MYLYFYFTFQLTRIDFDYFRGWSGVLILIRSTEHQNNITDACSTIYELKKMKLRKPERLTG